jgi:two-component system chemotaxis response regulator CheY
MKILIVDDEPVSREVLRKIVSIAGEHQITTADGGESAWALLDDPGRYFDVAFLDLSMPKLDGFDLLKRIRESPVLASVEVVVCTGSNDRPTIAKAIQCGARHYVVKPCTAAVVVAKLNQIRPPIPIVGRRRLAGVA